jgi:D-alanine-D-alanine ligase
MNSFLTEKKIPVLCGGPSAEREVSLRSGAAACKALKVLGAESFEIDVKGEDFFIPEGTDIVFNALHGTFGEDGTVQKILERKGVAYTGEGVAGSQLAFDKILTKRRFTEKGIPSPEFLTIVRGQEIEMELPFVIKAPCQGSSVGIYIVKERKEISPALDAGFRLAEELLVERFVPGRELTVGILGNQTLPIIEITPKGGFYSYENKYTWTNRGGAAEHQCPAHLTAEETEKVQKIALSAHKALNLEIYSRVDLIFDHNIEPQVLEVNTIPGMTETSLLPEAANAAGISMAKLCERIVQLSLERSAASRQ